VNNFIDDNSKGKQQRKLAAIMFTDMVGYSKLSQTNEALALELLETHREILRPIFVKHSGSEIETAGDSFFVEFQSAVDAANCAIEIQTTLLERNVLAEQKRQIRIRIGLHIGDIVKIGRNVHGDGVNIAARLEPLATPEGICLSEDFARAVQNKLDYPVVKKTEVNLKNISAPMNIYCIQLPWVKERDLEKEINKNFNVTIKKSLRYALPLTFIIIILLLLIYFLSPVEDNGEMQKRIAVLPFVNISKESEDDYFTDGITEEIISNLAKISGLDVIARTSIMKYKNTNLDVSQIGSELRVGTVLEGSVRIADNKTRITVQLIDVPTQKHLWAEDYDRELKDVFAIQSDIAMKVAKELKVQLLINEKKQIEKRGTENISAYKNYLLGNYYLNKRTGEDINRGMDYFNNAVEIDPNFAIAYTGIANCYTLIGGAAYGNLSREEASIKAKDAVLKALEIDETLAEALTSLAYINFRFDWNWDEAERKFMKALEFKPGYAAAHEWYALLLSLVGKYDDALNKMQRAYELDPLSPSISNGVGRMLDFSGRHSEAVIQYKKTLELHPDYAETHFALAMSYTMSRKINEALYAINKAIELSHGRLVMITQKGMIYGFAGKKKEALEILNEVEQLSYPNPISPWLSLSIYLSLEDNDKFFEFAYKAFEQKDPLMVYFKTLPAFNSNLQKEPRFHDILKKMKLEE
jgi:TolB-like protein/class 3 adenylate cyclase/Flp pilus assembly protein TadD